MADHAHTETLALRVQFDTEAQQKDASTLGMWIFLITEIMFFGGMFAVYTVYRNLYPDVFAIASSSLNEVIGAAQYRRAAVLQFHHGDGRARRPTRAAARPSSGS